MAGLIGDLVDTIAGGGYGDARDLLEGNVRDAKNLPLPVLKEFYPELYQQVVSMNPELETAVTLGPSQMEGVSTDPMYKQAQMNALSKLQEIGAAGGRDAQFESDAARLQNDINTNLKGQQGAIQQNMATRGMSGGMSEMVARQLAAQEAANRQSQVGLDLNAQAQQRALSSLMNAGTLGGQMQGQEFNQKSSVAQAADAINKFNAQNQQNVIGSNVAAKNQAQLYNVGQAQGAADKNVAAKNQAQQYNLGLSQQQYENELNKRGLISGATTGLAKNYTDESDRNVKVISQIGDAAAKKYFTGGVG